MKDYQIGDTYGKIPKVPVAVLKTTKKDSNRVDEKEFSFWCGKLLGDIREFDWASRKSIREVIVIHTKFGLNTIRSSAAMALDSRIFGPNCQGKSFKAIFAEKEDQCTHCFQSKYRIILVKFMSWEFRKGTVWNWFAYRH